MSSESRIILEMLKEGKIDAEEAERLLRALGEAKDPGETQYRHARGHQGRGHQGRGHHGRRHRGFGDRNFHGSSRRFRDTGLAKTVQEVLRTLGTAVDSAIRSKTDWFRDMASEFADGPEEPDSSRVKETVESTWSESLSAEGLDRLEIANGNGSVDVTGVEGDTVRVQAETVVRARDGDQAREFAEQIRIDLDRNRGQCRVSGEVPCGPRGLDAEVRFHVQCPPHLAVALHCGNGSLDIRDMNGSVTAETNSGNVTLNGARGRVKASTKNGEIRARITELMEEGTLINANGSIRVEVHAGTAPLEVKTFNGTIEVALPRDFDGRLDAYSGNGPIDWEGVKRESSRGRNSIRGEIGKGGDAVVRLRTLNGPIFLGQASRHR